MNINAIYCKLCNEILHSKSVHDWVGCKGKHFYTDGGNDYQRIGFDEKVLKDLFIVKLVPFSEEEK